MRSYERSSGAAWPSSARRAAIFVRLCAWLWVVLVGVGGTEVALAQDRGQLVVEEAEDWSSFEGRPLDAIQVETSGSLWAERLGVTRVRPGDAFSPEVARRALRELSETGRFADLRAELLDEEGRLTLVIWVRPRRLVAQVRLEGSALEGGEGIRALGLGRDDEVTDEILASASESLRLAHERAGFAAARVTVDPQATDDPLRVLLRVRVEPGEPVRLARVIVHVRPSPHHPALGPAIEKSGLRVGERQDENRIKLAVEELTASLVELGFYEAKVEFHAARPGELELFVDSGPRFSVRLEGHKHFGRGELVQELQLTEHREPKPDLLENKLRKFFVRNGFLDARVKFLRFDAPGGLESELYGWIREGERFRIESRVYPCGGESGASLDVDAEVDGVLSEQFPGGSLVEPPASAAVDPALVGRENRAPRPFEAAPYESYSEAAYQAVRSHLENLYRSEGYLDAEVGPVTLARRTCSPDSGPDECITTGPRPLPVVDCQGPPPGEKRSELVETCVPNLERGVRCEPVGTLVLPIHPGRQAVLYDVKVEGNQRFGEREILDVSELELGVAVRREEIEAALRRVKDLYAEEAYAFAEVESELELSPDRTRARLILGITERKQVRVTRVEVRGADKTREGLIRNRIAFASGDLYRRSSVQKSQRQIESLGVFTSVSVGLEDPGVPARDKVVVITVSERLPQYVDVKGGFSTGEGFRIGFEYGHRNLGGEAIQLTLRSQLGIRPPLLIAEEDVRQKYEELAENEELGLLVLLERRNTVTLAFAETGLGPLFRFEIEGLDAHTNQRDYAQTRDAGILRLLFRPDRQWLFQTGATVELNNAFIFGEEGKESLENIVSDNPDLGRIIRVPEGRSVAITQNLMGTWDRRDRALAAHRGTYLNAGVEHVTAVPVDERQGRCDEDATGVFDAACSELLRFTGRVAGYVPLSKKGLTFAVSLRSGVIAHLTPDSRTYPDRLFFMGGVDTIRSYPQDSLVPQDLAEQVLDRGSELTIEQVVLRGGDFFINPRAELRIPLVGNVETALFIDAGNVWADKAQIDVLELRYALGTGLRIETPVGPLVFDYGFNVNRIVDAVFFPRSPQRSWESLGAFHFSIGLF